MRKGDFVWTQVWARILKASNLYLVQTLLKCDLKGLREGKALKPKVTHFAPLDLAIEESTKKLNGLAIKHARIIRK